MPRDRQARRERRGGAGGRAGCCAGYVLGPTAVATTPRGRLRRPLVTSASSRPPATRRCYARRVEPKTERQADLVARARSLAAQFAVRAAEHDRAGSFPFDHFEAARRTGYTVAAVPESYGGGGYGLDDVALAQIERAKGAGATALGRALHLMMCGTEG
ncbi:MAG: acyl-CoA dehydrogenase family protein, partial [Chloroflexi bacterium]|nr:acyl-CoA dehydrogenase family protein [Chloroflexota bacterium]